MVSASTIGVLALIAAVIGKFGAEILLSLLKYSVIVVAGLAIHMTFVYSSAVRLFARMGPGKFFRGIRPAQLIAFSTSSSNATLPVTIECAEENLGVSEEISSFVLPLGATINMDGTALYEAVAAMFIAQSFGIHLELGQQIIIFLTATLAAIGAAGIPEAGLVTMILVLQSVNLPLEGIGMILTIDWFLDRCRTSINVWGDSVGAAIIARTREIEKSTARTQL